MQKTIYKIKITTLLAFAFSLFYLYYDPFGVRSSFTITKGLGLLYAILSIYGWRENFTLKYKNKRTIKTLFVFYMWMLLVSILTYNKTTGYVNTQFTLLQNVVLFWLVTNDINKNPKLKKWLFLSFSFGVLLAAILANFGIGVETGIGDSTDLDSVSRLYFFGMNPNGVGQLAMLASLLVISLTFNQQGKHKIKYLLLLTLPSLLMFIGYSGSRGAFFAFFAGLFIIFFLKKEKIKIKTLYAILGVLFIVIIFNFFADFQGLQDRITLTIVEGETGGRSTIWGYVLSIIYENPLFGVGSNYGHEMAIRYGKPFDPHNMYLYIWASTGLIGLSIFIYFLWLLLKSSIYKITKDNDTTDLMIFAVLLFITFKSGGIIGDKSIWLFYATIAPTLHIKQNIDNI